MAGETTVKYYLLGKSGLRVSHTAASLCLIFGGGLAECSSGRTATPPNPPPEVGVVTLHSQPVTITTDLPGRMAPYRIAEVRPQVSGVIVKRLFTEGSDVKAGQQLYQIDPAPFQANLESAQASLARARATLKSAALLTQRYKPLAEEHAVSQQNYDDAIAAESQARAQLTLEDNTRYEQSGTLQFAEVAVDSGTGSVTLRAVFPNPQHILLPGMFVHEQIEEGVNEHGLLVPQRAITHNARGEATTMVVGANNTVSTRVIKTERAIGDQWLVSDAVSAGHRVIFLRLH